MSGYCLDDQCDFQIVPVNPQQILAYSWYILRALSNPFFKSKIPLGYHFVFGKCLSLSLGLFHF